MDLSFETCCGDDILAVETMLFEVDRAEEDIVTLSKIGAHLETDAGDTSLKLAKVAVESISNRLGISVESDSLKDSIVEIIKRTWNAIKKAFSYIVEKLVNIIKSLYNFIFNRNEDKKEVAKSVINSDPVITLTLDPKEGNYEAVCIKAKNVSTESLDHKVTYKGPSPKVLLGEKNNAITIGSSIVNYNKNLSIFLDQCYPVLNNTHNELKREKIDGEYLEAYDYVVRNIPGLLDDHFGSSTAQLVEKFKIQSMLYYNREIEIEPYQIGPMELIKFKVNPVIEETKEERYIKITKDLLEQAEAMKEDVIASLRDYVRDYDKSLVKLLYIVKNACDDVIAKNAYTLHDTWYVHKSHRLCTIRDGVKYLLSFIASRILNATKQSGQFVQDIDRLFAVCKRAVNAA